MREYKSLDKFHIKGRGDVYVVECPIEMTERRVLFGPALIDGVVMEVIGVGAYAIHKIAKGTPIELLVKP